MTHEEKKTAEIAEEPTMFFFTPDGMEDIYRELAGSGGPGETSQLLLVGMMTGRAEIAATETRVKIRLCRT